MSAGRHRGWSRCCFRTSRAAPGCCIGSATRTATRWPVTGTSCARRLALIAATRSIPRATASSSSFADACDAVSAATRIQRELTEHAWPEGAELRVRIGLHTGTPTVTTEGYFGLDVHVAARICAAAHGAQVVVSASTVDALDESERGALRVLGEHHLKDLPEPELLYQLVVEGLPRDFPAAAHAQAGSGGGGPSGLLDRSGGRALPIQRPGGLSG